MGGEKREYERTRAHWGVELQWAANSARGLTENLSMRGAMLSLEDEPPIRAGEKVTVSVQLPARGRRFEMSATVRWLSEMLPNTVGIEFDEALPEDAVGVLRAMATASASQSSSTDAKLGT